TRDFWAARRTSKAQPFLAGLAMFLFMPVFAALSMWARHNGMPAWTPGARWWIYFVVFLFVQTAIHELGHAGMAWVFFNRVRVIAIGPLTFWNDGWGYQIRFDWKRLLDSNGYMGAVPTSEERLVLNQIAITAAGPAASFITGLLLLLTFFAMPGSGLE